MSSEVPTSELDSRGLRRIAIGAGIGVAAGIAALVLPVSFLWLAAYDPGGFFTFGTLFTQTIGVLVLAGAILFLLSLVVYRTAFSVLRRADRRFAAASVLCLVGSIGFLLLVVSAALLLGSSSSVVACVHGEPRQALSCLRSSTPLGADTGLVGFWLGWVGGIGLVLGLFLTAGRFHRGSVTGGAALYALLILVLIGPFLALLYTVPSTGYLLLAAPVLALVAPAFVFAGSVAPPSNRGRPN